MAKRKQPLTSYSSEPHEVMSIDESETLLDSSLTSSLNVYPGGGAGQQSADFPPHHRPAYNRESSLGSNTTQSTTLTGNSKFMSPAVTVVDIDLKARSIDEFEEIQRATTHHQRRMRRRKSYDGINEEMSAKTKSSSMLLGIDSSQNVSREGLGPQASGNNNCKRRLN